MRIRQYLGWVVILCVWTHGAGAGEAPACDPWAAKIASAQGKVEARRSKATDWQAVKLDETFCPGDRIRVGENSRAGIILANETLVRLDQNTAINLTAIEKDSLSLIEILQGIAHFISRVPRSLKVTTPFVNAAIEGTEFVVEVGNTQSSVTVFEGTVLTQNDHGELRITNNETAVANQDAAPKKTLLSRPRDTVQWALYFPPIFEADNGKLSDASRLLYSGRVAETQELLQGMDSGEARALLAIIAIVNNEKASGFRLASDAIQQAPQSAASHIAMSYAWQAKLDLAQALGSARQATSHEPDNAIAWARLAELQLSVGELDNALASAKQATQLNANLSRTQSILGYAYLVRIDIDNAMTVFNRAIELDQADPLPRLGLGLAKIRRNHLTEGRRDIEIAALLDPNNAIIRSYLGKAYYEEKRAPLDATQFDMAKALDPNDPTPYYYDAIRKQSENRPVEALADLNKSIELNDNRAVYRSSLQLDQDEAARSASQARIYSDIGFEEQALLEGWKSFNNDPANYSTHRFLADSYASDQRHQISRVSEILQSQLLQPLNTTPLKPQLTESKLLILEAAGPSKLAFNEFNPLFTRNTHNLFVDGIYGSFDTKGSDVVLSGLHENFSYSIGAFSYRTDGFRANNHYSLDKYNLFLQAAVSDSLSIQAEANKTENQHGDISLLFDPDDFSAFYKNEVEAETYRLGIHHKTNRNTDIILSLINSDETQTTSDRDTGTFFGFPLVNIFSISGNPEGKQAEIQAIYHGDSNLIIGLGSYTEDSIASISLSTSFNNGPFDTVTGQTDLGGEYKNIYIYNNISLSNNSSLLLGLSYDDVKREYIDFSQTNPKLGLMWNPTKDTTLRVAHFKNVKRFFAGNQSIEPTQVAGFSQFYDDIDATKVKNNGIALDHSFFKNLHTGLEYIRRELRLPIYTISPTSSSVREERQDENIYRAYLNWGISNKMVFSTHLQYSNLERELAPTTIDTERAKRLDTYKFPLKLIYHGSSGITWEIISTHYDQEIENPLSNGDTEIKKEKFWLTDLNIKYRLNNRLGMLGISAKNIFDKKFRYQDTNIQSNEPNIPTVVPEKAVYAFFNLAF